MKTSSEIRSAFLDYFVARGHASVESSSLVPHNDPTLLFTNAGMVQFKDVFLGNERRPYTKAVSSQKCMRAGGKHNDLENVGHTARHHTFFEMLGNFSFGDYFKQQAISMAWDFLTRTLGIDRDRLWISVFEKDDEAFALWQAEEGVVPERIVRLGEKDNFWSMGDTGPCGPCSEILIDQGEAFGCGRADCRVGCDCDRYLELWNLVFMQYNRDAQGAMTPLPRPSIDTGMGLERVAAVLQGAASNYDTDLFQPVIALVESLCGVACGAHADHDVSMRVIADHARAAAFLIADGVLPSNEGRGYVLRRIMRRAARRGRLLGMDKPFLHEAAGAVAHLMAGVYPEVLRSLDYVQKVILNEEQHFSATLAAGLKMLEDEICRLRQQGRADIPGDVAFKLYDTYGFPLDLTSDIARDQALGVDEEGFHRAMRDQKARARQAWKGSGDEKVAGVYSAIVREGLGVACAGHDVRELRSTIARIIRNGQMAQEAGEGDEVEIITPETPFYGESGGQAGDSGSIAGEGFRIDVAAAFRPLEGLVVHRGRVAAGRVTAGAPALLKIRGTARGATAANHTATHILQAVLRARLGNHVKQAGSLVEPERLRFDFTHFEALTPEALAGVEDAVNDSILANVPVTVREVPRRQALDMGATALFGEKYGDTVRVVSIGDCSMELCGGTHIGATGEIGLFKITGESAVAAGVRRIEAVTGQAALRAVGEKEGLIARLSDLLKTEPAALVSRVERLLAANRELERENARLAGQLMSGQANSVLDGVRQVAGVKVLAARIDGKDPRELRIYGDQLRDRLGSGIIVFGSGHDDKAHLLAMVAGDLTGRFSAGEIIKDIAPLIGGKGGGRRDMAQAGGRDIARLDAALEHALRVIEQMAAGA